jgi:Aldo/keto reductases, related to diketogulonate reductase
LVPKSVRVCRTILPIWGFIYQLFSFLKSKNFNLQISDFIMFMTSFILRPQVQSGTIPIPKSNTVKRITENINVFDFTLEQSDVDKIDALDKKQRSCVMAP